MQITELLAKHSGHVTSWLVACLQWLAFRKDGSATAAAWAQKAAHATAEGKSVGDGEFMDLFEPQRRIQRRRAFAQTILRNTMQVLQS